MKKFIITLAFYHIITLLMACKKQQDYSYLNTDRRAQVILVSQRFTNPPKVNENGTWKADTTIWFYYHKDTDHTSYIGMKPDTIISNCAIGGIDPRYTTEIRNWQIKFNQ